MINGIHHVAIVTRGFERMLTFYTDGVGFEVAYEAAWEVDNPYSEAVLGIKDSAGRLAVLRAGNAYLELHEYLEPAGRSLPEDNRPCDQGYRHICLDVTDIDAVYERLLAAGMHFPAPPTRIEGLDLRTVYARDPEGNLVEVQETLTRNGLALSNLEKLGAGAWTP